MRFTRLRRANRTRLVIVAVSVAALVVGTGLATGSAAAASAPRPVPNGITQSSSYTALKSMTGQLARTDPSVLKLTGTRPVPVMVKLDFDALASYMGNIRGFAATSPHVTGHPLNPNSAASKKYLSYIHGMENTFIAALSSAVPAATVDDTYDGVYGGVAVRVPADQVSKLLSLPAVAAVQADNLQHPNVDPVS